MPRYRCILLLLAVPLEVSGDELALPGSACFAKDGDDQDDVEYQDDDYGGGGSIINVHYTDLQVVCPVISELVYPPLYPLSGTEIYMGHLEVEVYAPLGDDVTCTQYACDLDGAPCYTNSDTTDDDYFDVLEMTELDETTGRHIFLQCTLPVDGRVVGYRWEEVEI